MNLVSLIELKIASGISSPHRGQDLVDVQRLIETLRLPRRFGERLNPYVRAKFDELWIPRRWVRLIDETADHEELLKMRLAGVAISPWTDGKMLLASTEDPELSKEFDMHDESELAWPGTSGNFEPTS